MPSAPTTTFLVNAIAPCACYTDDHRTRTSTREALLAGERILVVDDGADMREFVIKYVLKPNGFAYVEARDGLEGWEQIEATNPDLILLDLQMPRLDGLGLLHRMREADL